MLTHSATKDNHACFYRLAGEFIESADVAHNVDYQSRRMERMKIHHVPQRAVGKGRAEHRDIILDELDSVPRSNQEGQVQICSWNSLCRPSNTPILRYRSPSLDAG